jgi:hypothetical protein
MSADHMPYYRHVRQFFEKIIRCRGGGRNINTFGGYVLSENSGREPVMLKGKESKKHQASGETAWLFWKVRTSHSIMVGAHFHYCNRMTGLAGCFTAMARYYPARNNRD